MGQERHRVRGASEADLKALGFHKLQSTVEHEDTPQIRGMIEHVRHLVVWTSDN